MGAVNTASSTSTGSSATAPLSRVSGRSWKAAKKPANRSMMAKSLSKSYEKRIQQARDHKAFKSAEAEMKEEKRAEKEEHRNRIIERKKKYEEKLRQERYQAEMSARKRMRVKRKELKARVHAKH
ncbi:hypothetical protein GGI04_003169 [Coemansia thaxteri]|uniref:rRNA-processing protein n=1 Tax=Coemansia thaxteri TaxID=2663907 RepID=A0A9W8EFU9_9FUNG|nr:hypothetical protein GGI04_003169 [Coemansia thaxteri]KAJ2004330.1 hypothetical protein H4R26_002578 [Coemansia thaxteri]KAJ2484659.1 hypothetical protein EV174_002266 [Coemansia sp. RSA 2320]